MTEETAQFFTVEIDGLPEHSFSSVSGLESRTRVIEYRPGAGAPIRKIPGETVYSNLELARAWTGETSLWKWRDELARGVVDRRSVLITLLTRTGDILGAWEVDRAWPCAWALTPMDSQGAGLVVEAIELCHEGIHFVGG